MGNMTCQLSEGYSTEDDCGNITPPYWIDSAYGLALEKTTFVIGIILIFVLMLTTKRKQLDPRCCNGYFALIVPVNFLESRKKRKIIIGVCALMTLDILDILDMLHSEQLLPENVPVTAKISAQAVLVAMISIKFLPLLRCIYVSSLFTDIIGLFYAILIIITAIVASTPNPDLPIEDLVDDLILRTIILLTAGVYVMYWFIKRIVALTVQGKFIQDIDSRVYEVKYVKNLLISQRRRQANTQVLCSVEENSRLHVFKKWFETHIYHSVPGFRYSLTILASCAVGFLGITKAATKSAAITVWIFDISYESLELLAAQKEQVKIPNFVKHILKYLDKNSAVDDVDDEIDIFAVLRVQIIVILLAILSSLIISYILSCVLICRLLLNYRSNVLNIHRKKSSQDVLPVSSLSNINLVLLAIQYLGYQVAYLIIGFAIQSGFLLLALLILCEIVLFPIQFAFRAFFAFVLQLFFMLILIKATQYLLVRFAFLEDGGKTLAITNRRGFFITMYVVFFYNIITGFVSCVVRITKCALIGIIMVPRLDSSLYPKQFAKYDAGFKAYSCLLHLEALQCNPILRSFVNILLKKDVSSYPAENCSDNRVLTMAAVEIDENHKKIPIARNRWFVAVTLARNPTLMHQRSAYLRSVALKNSDIEARPINDNAAYEQEAIV